MEKREVEVLLKRKITDEQFEEALEYAKEKQRYIYEKDHREVVLQEWYLIQLTKECVISLSFSRYTMELCRRLRILEKENAPATPTKASEA